MISKELQDELKMNLEKERDVLRTQLQKLGSRTHVKSDEDYTAEHRDYGDDIDENAQESADDAARDENVNHLELRLKNILDALTRMEDGTYGVDEKTGEPIAEARLRANPSARTAE